MNFEKFYTNKTLSNKENETIENEEIFSKILRAGRRTYFFDVRSTKSNDYYITITESKKFTEEDGSFYFKKHKIYLYKEDFESFSSLLEEMIGFVFQNKGSEVISDRHEKDFHKSKNSLDEKILSNKSVQKSSDFTSLDFEDI